MNKQKYKWVKIYWTENEYPSVAYATDEEIEVFKRASLKTVEEQEKFINHDTVKHAKETDGESMRPATLAHMTRAKYELHRRIQREKLRGAY